MIRGLKAIFSGQGPKTGPDSSHFTLGVKLLLEGRFAEAESAFQAALAVAPRNGKAFLGLGDAYWGMRRFTDAGGCYMRASEIDARDPVARASLADVLFVLGRQDESLAHYRKAVALDPEATRQVGHRSCYGDVLSKRVIASRSNCDWANLEAEETELLHAVRHHGAYFRPIILLFMSSSPADLLQCASRQMASLHLSRAPMPRSRRAPGGRIRLGYVGGTFHAHASTYLIAQLFEMHDRTRFEVTAYSIGIDDGSDWRARVKRGVDHFVDIRGVSDADAARRISRDRIDILVDLMGLMEPHAFGILAHRPAPVQVSFLGFPGTMGVDFVDYVLADAHVAPMDDQPHYREKIVHLPYCYQPNDNTKVVAAETPSRAECGLPESAFVFCTFNAPIKYTPTFFAIWMRLLKGVPGSVLWLMEPGRGGPVDAVVTNLRRTARMHGVDPDRLVFAPRVELSRHLARHRCADLFLDSLPYCAHTTMSDALWAGLPAVTCMGDTFAGRVGASLLHAIGLPELVTTTPETYEALALALATDASRLADIRQKLAQNRLASPLFDTQTYARGIETAYERMWSRWLAGESPQPFAVDPASLAPPPASGGGS